MHEVRATVKFDLTTAGIPAGATITSAKLSVYRTHEPKTNLSYGYDQDGLIYCETSKLDWSTNTESFTTLFPQVVSASNVGTGDVLNYKEQTVGWLDFDVTTDIASMIADPSSNKGFIFRGEVVDANASGGMVSNTTNFKKPGSSGILGSYASSENSDAAKRPKLEITYILGNVTYYSLSVENGSNGGSYYEGQQVTVTAKDSAGYLFDSWSGSGSAYLNATTEKSAVLTMPGQDVSLIANYSEAVRYSVAVENGSGSGDYFSGESFSITAKDSSGFVFDIWSGDVSVVDNAKSKTATVTVGESDITLTSTYREASTGELFLIPQSELSVKSFSSEYASAGRYASATVDGDDATFWHNNWATGTDGIPQSIVYEIDQTYSVAGFSHLPRQDNSGNGRVNEYRIEVSTDGSNWSELYSGNLPDVSTETMVEFGTVEEAKFVRFTALSDHGDQALASMAELNLYYAIGSTVTASIVAQKSDIVVRQFNRNIELSLPQSGIYSVKVANLRGQTIVNMTQQMNSGANSVDLSTLSSGIYMISIDGVGAKKVVKTVIR